MRQHGETSGGFILFEVLRLQVHRNVVNLFLGEERFLNFFLGYFRRILGGTRSKITVARLHAEFFFGGQCNLQRVEAPVELQILRRKTKDIGNLGRGASFAHGFIHVVAVVVKGAAGTVGQLCQNVLLCALRADAVSGLVTGGTNEIVWRIGNVAHDVRRIEAARINGVDNNIGARGAIHHV